MADHLVDVVNEKDEVIRQELKSRRAELGFVSRVVAIFIRDSSGRFIICKRADNKTFDPGKFDLSACGHVEAGESYQKAAERELKEELGISCRLKLLEKSYQETDYNGKKLGRFCSVFLGNSDETPKLNHELVLFRRMTVKEIEKEVAKNPELFCPGFILDFNNVVQKLEKQ